MKEFFFKIFIYFLYLCASVHPNLCKLSYFFNICFRPTGPILMSKGFGTWGGGTVRGNLAQLLPVPFFVQN